MKTIVEVPELLFQVIATRAAGQGQDVSAAVEDLLRMGLAVAGEPAQATDRAVIKRHPDSGRLYVECPSPAPPGQELTPERVAEILLEQDVAWHHEAGRQ